MELDEVAGLAGEGAAETLLLHDEAGVVADKKPLEILGSHFVDIKIGDRDGDMMVFRSERISVVSNKWLRCAD